MLLLLAMVLAGMLTGGMVATRFFHVSDMGWDGIASALGGVMAGGLAGLVAWFAGVRTLKPFGRLLLSGAALSASGALWWYLSSSMAHPVGEPVAVERAAPPVRPFTFHLGTAESVEGPAAVNERLLWQFLRISSGLTFDYVPAGRPNQHCVAENIADDLAGIQRFDELRTLLTALPREVDCGEPCRSCAEVSLEWFLDQDRHVAVLTDRCWNTHPALQDLRTSVEGIVAAAYGRVICN